MSVASPSPSLPREGDRVGGKYVIEDMIGRGGMGIVFKAKHAKLGNTVAIKMMLADAGHSEAAARFINEGRSAANLQSEHVVRVFDVDEEKGYAYMVLELLEGEDLQQILQRSGRLSPHVAVDYVAQALEGVAEAHACGIVHRDLKPSNLYLARRKDGGAIVKVLDFGISKMKKGSPLEQSPNVLTSTAAMLGSPLYMSPEQLRSSKSVDQRADIWAIGVILYELVTGRMPFGGETLGELFAAILETDPPPLREGAPEATPQLEAIVLRCLQRKPEARFQSARELAAALRSLGAGAISPHASTSSPPELGPPPGTPPPGATPMRPPSGAAIHTPAPGPPPLPSVSGPIGLAAPQPYRTTNDAWQASSSAVAVPRSNAPLVVLGLAALLVASAGAVGVWRWKASKARDAQSAAATAAASATAPARSQPESSGREATTEPAPSAQPVSGVIAAAVRPASVASTRALPAPVASVPPPAATQTSESGHAANRPTPIAAGTSARPTAAAAAPVPQSGALQSDSRR